VSLSTRPERVVDVECFRNWFNIGFTDVATRTHLDLAWPLDAARVRQVLAESCIITFNGWNYDVPMIVAALAGHPPETLKDMSDAIIQRGLRPWQFYEHFNLSDPGAIDHVDLIEVAPGIASLKAYGARLHSKQLQDLPFPHDHWLSLADVGRGTLYCRNDRITTIDLLESLRPQLELRVRVGAEYGLDLRSKSDAQMAEAIMRQAAGGYVERPQYPVGTEVHYRAPDWIRFQTPGLQRALDVAQSSPFVVAQSETTDGELVVSLAMHERLSTMQVVIRRNAYRMGMGGLHSSESCVVQRADAGHELSDHDVASYYPRLIQILGIEPPQLRGVFTRTFNVWVARRLAAKARCIELEGRLAQIEIAERDALKRELIEQKAIRDGFKVAINGTFGKLGSRWSVMYHPESMVRVTLTGQLALLMLIERLELAGIAVVSANTDGIVIRCPMAQRAQRDAILQQWGVETGLETEAAQYSALWSRDVNNYIAVKPDGKVKTKGAYAIDGLAKNPNALVATDAVIAFVARGVPIETTVALCTDVRRLVATRKVADGAVWNGQALGKNIRWYYSATQSGAITYAESGRTVPDSEGAQPCMILPEELPADVDRQWYVRRAASILRDIGHTSA
jgi:hypothetical protein